VEQNQLFVVDLRCLEKPKDVMCDDMGSWVSNGDYTAWVVVDEDGAVDTVRSLTKSGTISCAGSTILSKGAQTLTA